jgi:alkylation response protein AidB-like acyl-CoA dehydrogenase
MDTVAHGPGEAPKGDKLRQAIEEYAIESSIAKVFGTEAVAWSIDEALQIHGGMGFSEEYAIEKSYRDNRVNRIFEGTNEINRLLIPGQLLKRAMKGQIALMPAVAMLLKEIEGADYAFPAGGELLDGAIHATELTKKLTLLAYSAATQRYMMKIDKEQQVLMLLADLTMQSYAADSACIRAKALVDAGRLEPDATQVQVTALFAADALDKARGFAKQVILACYEGDKLQAWRARLAKLDQSFDVNRVALRRAIAADVVAHEKYNLSVY